jgi:intracellular septation protein A
MTPTMFLTQLLPLIVFIIVDSFVSDVRISILSAIVFAIGQLVFTWARTHQFDWFVLLDVALIVGFGVVSIVLENDLFFKIKPAVIEAITIVFMLVLILAPDRFLTGYFARMAPEMSFNPEALGAMRTILWWMCGYMLLHIGAVLYTAFYSSKRVWAFVSGPGFYLIFIPIMGVVLGRALLARRRARHAGPTSAPSAAPLPCQSVSSEPGSPRDRTTAD